MENKKIVEEMKKFNDDELYFMINLCETTRQQFFDKEFGENSFDDEGSSVIIFGINYAVYRVMINGEQFLVKDHEVVRCVKY